MASYDPAQDLLDQLRDAVDRAVSQLVPKAAIIEELTAVLEEVRDDESIPE